ncbi:MAG: hypothetical protein V1873_09035 [Verrucomicrobiota bacterium]
MRRLIKPRGRILRIRPGHLANFSGGAGYMPFIAGFSVPLSALYGVVSSLIVFFTARATLSKPTVLEPRRKTDLATFVKFAWIFLIICAVLGAVTGGVLFVYGLNMVYGDLTEYAGLTFLFTFGPLVAWYLALLLLVWLSLRYSPRWYHLALAVLAYVALMGIGVGVVAMSPL